MSTDSGSGFDRRAAGGGRGGSDPGGSQAGGMGTGRLGWSRWMTVSE
jgi:hypothetical protein